MPSFDIVSKIDNTAVENALAGVTKEMQVRYDFKGSSCEVSRTDEAILIKADDELKRRQVEELIVTHLTRKGVDTKALEFEKPEQAGGNTIRQTVLIRQGVQRDIAQKIVKAIKRNRVGLKDPNKPIGSFIFLGPTGVGKTQLAKKLTELLFDNEDNMIRIDMSEYMEKFAISRLVGAPPGYVGYEEGGQLTERVRRKPYSVILLDEIEKAHPDVFNLLLQALDDGQITDSLGRKVDFKNTIIIMTSNLGSRQLKDFGTGVGFGTTARDQNKQDLEKGVIQSALKKAFAPEFLNRIDDVVLFNSLKRADIHEIIDIELKGLLSRVAELGYKISLSEEAKDFVADEGFDEAFGARPLARALQKLIEDPLAERIIGKQLNEGDEVIIELKDRN